MRVITDLDGRKWKLQITVGSINAVRDALSINLYDISDEGFIKALLQDQIKIVEMFWVLLEEQAKEEFEIDEKKFCYGFSGDIIADATHLFLEELLEFFPIDQRAALTKMLSKTREVQKAQGKAAEKIVDDINVEEEVTKAVAMAMENTKHL